MGVASDDRDGEAVNASNLSSAIDDRPKERRSRVSKSGDKPRDRSESQRLAHTVHAWACVLPAMPELMAQDT